MQCDTLTGRLSKKVRQTFLGHFNNPSRATIRTETTWSDNLELSFKTVTTLKSTHEQKSKKYNTAI